MNASIKQNEHMATLVFTDYVKTCGVLTHHINSFERFLNQDIQSIVKQESEIRVKIGDGKTFTVKFGEVYVNRPHMINEERVITTLYPSQARVDDLNYESSVYVDATEIVENDDGLVLSFATHRRLFLAKIPVMVGSSMCNLSTVSELDRIKLGECEHDKGGYFILKGKERVLVGQLHNAYNESIVYRKKNIVVEMRSMSDETAHSIQVQVVSDELMSIFLSVSILKSNVPIGIVFKAFGFDESWFDRLVGSDGTKQTKIIVRKMIRECAFVKSQSDALEYIGRLVNINHNSKDLNFELVGRQFISIELFPHIGFVGSDIQRVYLIGGIVKKLIRANSDPVYMDDRDNLKLKRVEYSGTLLSRLFRTLFKRYLKTIETFISKKKYNPDIASIMSRVNLITTGIRSCMQSGNWGVHRNTYIRTGVSQVLSRYNIGSSLSHLRRFSIPIGKEGKNAQIRQINPSQIMFVCPNESPEGQQCGVVLNLSLMTQVSLSFPSLIIVDLLLDISEFIDVNYFDGSNTSCGVFVNGILYGYTPSPASIVSTMRKFRRCGRVAHDVSIAFDEDNNEIRILSDEGRFIRPLFTLDEHRKKLRISEFNLLPHVGLWTWLVENKCVEFLDASEINNISIAMYAHELDCGNYDYCEIFPASMLGVMSSIVPFADHTQSPRVIYQSSMGKQSLGVHAMSFLNRTDTISYILNSPQQPIVSTLTSRLLGFSDMPCGVNAVVAIMCYTGFNQEDSVIMNKSSVDRGMFVATSYRTLVHVDRKKSSSASVETICFPPIETRKKGLMYDHLDTNGIVKKGSRLVKGDVIIGKTISKTNKTTGQTTTEDNSVYIKGSEEEGVVDRIIMTTGTTTSDTTLVKIVVRNQYIPEMGDKFCSREAQKGTVGVMYDQQDMPFTKDGIVPDLVINSHCIPSRMTINQLLESVFGKSCAFKGKLGDATPFTSNSTSVAQKLCDDLGSCGFERTGLEQMYDGFTGEPIKAQIFMGVVYYQRLKHLVKDKMHSRSHGHVTSLMRQPLEGRSKDGGLRFGEMERDCMISHGVSRFLKERLFDYSDMYHIFVCSKCGNMVSFLNEDCRMCSNDVIEKVNMPYAAKLLLQELNAMSIKTTLKIT
jgi:DNA-directed RNA polymerase II subunit RPB2